jgi:LysR family glycine cleavage system transcriptional activator
VMIAATGSASEAIIAWSGDEVGALVRVADAGLAIDAAAAGFGRTTVPEMLARREIAAGNVQVVGDAQPSRGGYWLVAPLPQWRQKKVRALVDALTA